MKTGALQRTVIYCLVALAGAAAPRARGESAESLARKGNSLYTQGKFDEAAEAYRQALMRNPDNSVIKFNLGTALARAGNVPDAQKALTESAETPGAPRRGDAYYNLGVAQAESTRKKPEDQAPRGAAAQPGAPNPVEAAQQKVAMLEQSLAAFRKSILTNAQDARQLQECQYNYETVLEMLKQARQQLEQQKQQQQQQQQGDGKDGDQQQEGRNQDDPRSQEGQGQDQQQQNRKDGQKDGQRQQQGQDGGQTQQQQGQGGQDGKGRMTPEQIDALGLLNMLESEKPEQFKQLYKFRGDNNSQRHPTKDW